MISNPTQYCLSSKDHFITKEDHFNRHRCLIKTYQDKTEVLIILCNDLLRFSPDVNLVAAIRKVYDITLQGVVNMPNYQVIYVLCLK